MSDDPFGAMAVAAMSLNELYRSYVQAGFTEQQAMQLLCAILSASIQGGTNQ